MMTPETVRNALAAKHEFDELCSAATPQEREQLYLDAIEDPYYRSGLEVDLLLTRLDLGLGALGIQKTLDIQSATHSEAISSTDIQDLLQEIELAEPENFELQALCAQDVTNVHAALDRYNTVRGRIGGKPTRKQQQDLLRALRSELPASYLTELAASPERTRTVLDSIACKEGVREKTRQELGDQVEMGLQAAVKKQLESYDPAMVADILRVCAIPGLSNEKLEKLYLGNYFNGANSNDAESVLNNYELFIGGLLRVLDRPETARYAANIAHFATSLLPANGRYHYMLLRGTVARLDRPDIIRRTLYLARMDAKLSAKLAIEGINGPQGQDMDLSIVVLSNAKQALQVSKETIDGRSITGQATIALKNLGYNRFVRRGEVFSQMQAFASRVIGSQGSMSQFIEQMAADSDQTGSQPDAVELIYKFLVTRARDNDERQFVHDLFYGDDWLQAAMDPLLSDLTINPMIKSIGAEDAVVDHRLRTIREVRHRQHGTANDTTCRNYDE